MMVPELVVTTYNGAPLPWGEVGGKMGVRPTRRPEPLEPTLMPVVLEVVMMLVEVVEAAAPAVPVVPVPPKECVMILAPVPGRGSVLSLSSTPVSASGNNIEHMVQEAKVDDNYLFNSSVA